MRYRLYSGAGNTFAMLEEAITSDEAAALAEMCDVDGVIFPEETFRMRIFNRDGSEAEMCGNGLRCFVKFLRELGIDQPEYCIETLSGTHTAWVEGERVRVAFPPVTEYRWNLEIEGQNVHFLNTGVPHAVLFVEDFDLMELAPVIRHHPHFPEGANVDFVQLDTLHVRTYERGVEGETLACGTGVVASALAASKIHGLPSPLTLQVQSGERITITFTSDWQSITMKGPAHRLGEGNASLKYAAMS